MASATRKAWYRRPWLWVLVGLGVVVLVVAIGLQPFVRYQTRRSLDRMEGFYGTFSDVHLSLIPLQYSIEQLKLQRMGEPDWRPPMFYAEHFQVGLDLGKLARGHVVAQLILDRAKFALVNEAQPEAKPEKKTVSFGDQLKQLMPLDLNRLEVKRSQLVYQMGPHRQDPSIWIHDLNATLENVATRPNLAEGVTTLALRGTVQRSGKLSAFVTADPLQKQLTFAGQAELLGLRVSDLDALIEQKAKLEVPQGTLDLFARFDAKNGFVTGGVKPVLKNARVASTSPNLGDQLKAGLADLGLELFSDRVPNRNAVATVIPIKGNLSKPNLQLWPTVLGVIRNSFVQGISESFRNVPPPTAGKKEGPLRQARRALSKPGPVEAQPAKPAKPKH